jgi:hypothetical protein
MQSRRPISEVITELREWQHEHGWSHAKVALKSKVNLSTVYRILDEEAVPVRYGSALKRICKIAKVSIYRQASGEVPAEVRSAVLETWDGSAEHARRLAVAIRVIGDLVRVAVSSK